MWIDKEHRLKDNLGRTFLYTRRPQFEGERQLRKEAVLPYKVFAQQHFQVIAESGTDPFHYGLLDLWLEVYQEPWNQPRNLHKLIDDLAEKIASRELLVYLEDSLMWRHVSSIGASGGRTSGFVEADRTDEVRSRSEGAAKAPVPPWAAPASSDSVSAGSMTLADRRGVPPASLEDAVQRLNSMGEEISDKGYTPKYSDSELLTMAASGNVAAERFHVRFMESVYLTRNGQPGMLGAPLEGATGNGAKYWSTTFDQIEDCDTDAELLCGKVGLDYDPKTEYALVVIDTEVARPLTGVESVPATFEKVSEFANRELPDEFPKEFTDETMNPVFQKKYAEHHSAALKNEFLDDEWSNDIDDFEDYLDTQSLNQSEKSLLIDRMRMHKKLGNNQYYEGNGLTKCKIKDSPNEYGAVETLNFERCKVNLGQLKGGDAIAEPIIMRRKG